MRFLSRETLGLAPPRSPLSPFRPPAQRLFLHHSVTPSFGTDYARAAQLIQRVAFERGFSDASYGVGVVPDGTVLELRGFDWIGAHTVNDAGDSYNSIAHAIVLVGNYDLEVPSPAQVESVRAIRALLMAGGKLTPASPFDPHRAVRSTACPGQHAYDLMSSFRLPWVPPLPPLPDLEVLPMFIVRCPSLPAGNPPLLIADGKGRRRIASQTLPAYEAAGVPIVTLDEGDIPNDVAADEYRKYADDLPE